MNPSDPDPLNQLAAQWCEDAAPRPHLRRKVWARIEAAEAARPGRRLQRFATAVRFLWRQRALAGVVAVCVVIGIVSAELRATRTPMQDIGRVASTYLQVINPLLRGGTGAAP